MPSSIRRLARHLLLANGALLLACTDRAEAPPHMDDCLAPSASTDGALTDCAPMVAVEAEMRPPSTPGDATLRPAVTTMLRALMDSTLPPAMAAAPRLVCIAPEPLPRRELPYDPRLRFLTDPDSALLAELQRPGVLLFHPRRCPPTLEVSARLVEARPLAPPPGEDPTYLSVRELMVEPNGALYADMAVARGARGEFWICAVLRDDLTTVRCTASNRTWTQ